MSESSDADEVLQRCGEVVLGVSWWVQARMGAGEFATTAQYYFIERRNSWLLWGQMSQ